MNTSSTTDQQYQALSKKVPPKTSAGRISYWLDECFTLPGGHKFGFDGIIGLVPGVGDLFSSGISSVILYKAYKQKVPFLIFLAMVANVIIDTIIGAIPIVGDIFDFFWKANKKNAYLLDSYAVEKKAAYKKSYASLSILALMAAVIVLLTIAAVYLITMVLGKIF